LPFIYYRGKEMAVLICCLYIRTADIFMKIKLSEKEKKFILTDKFQANEELLLAFLTDNMHIFYNKLNNLEWKEEEYSSNTSYEYKISKKDIIEFLEENLNKKFFTIKTSLEDLKKKGYASYVNYSATSNRASEEDASSFIAFDTNYT